MQGNRFSIYCFSISASPQGQGHHNRKCQILRATLPLNFLCGRKPVYPEKTHDFRQNKFLVRSHGEYSTNLALRNHHVIILALMRIRAYGSKLCNNKFTWCFHKTKFQQSVDLLFSHED